MRREREKERPTGAAIDNCFVWLDLFPVTAEKTLTRWAWRDPKQTLTTKPSLGQARSGVLLISELRTSQRGKRREGSRDRSILNDIGQIDQFFALLSCADLLLVLARLAGSGGQRTIKEGWPKEEHSPGYLGWSSSASLVDASLMVEADRKLEHNSVQTKPGQVTSGRFWICTQVAQS